MIIAQHVTCVTARAPLTHPSTFCLTPTGPVSDEPPSSERGGVSDYTRSRVRCPQRASFCRPINVYTRAKVMSHNRRCVPFGHRPRTPMSNRLERIAVMLPAGRSIAPNRARVKNKLLGNSIESGIFDVRFTIVFTISQYKEES